MEKKSFDYLKTLASLVNCFDVVEADVEHLPDDLDVTGLKTRVNHLKFWVEKLVEEYDAK